jgi:hypothetical protein
MEGLEEEEAERKEERRQANIANCNKPFFWYDPISKQMRCALPTCKDWTCEHCNSIRARDEQERLERALDSHETVYAVFDLPESEWLKLARAFKSANITKEMYRRLPQDNSLVTVFYCGSYVSQVVDRFERESQLVRFGSQAPRASGERQFRRSARG